MADERVDEAELARLREENARLKKAGASGGIAPKKGDAVVTMRDGGKFVVRRPELIERYQAKAEASKGLGLRSPYDIIKVEVLK